MGMASWIAPSAAIEENRRVVLLYSSIRDCCNSSHCSLIDNLGGAVRKLTKHRLWKEILSQQRIRHFEILQSIYFAYDVGIISSYSNRIKLTKV